MARRKETRQTSEPSDFWEYCVSIALGIGSGLSAAIVTIHREFWDDIKDTEVVKKITRETKERLEHETKAAIQKLPEAPHHWPEELRAVTNRNIRHNTVAETVSRIKAEQSAKLNLQTEKMGYASIGTVRKYTIGTIDRLRTLSFGSKVNIFVNSLVTVGVTAAATHMFFNSHRMRESFRELDHKLDYLDKKLDALPR